MRRNVYALSPLLPLAAFIAAGCVLAAAVHFSQPSDMEDRMSAIRQTISRTARLQAQPGSTGGLPAGALCTGSSEAAAASYKARIVQLATANAVPSAGLSIGAGDEPDGRIRPIVLRWKGQADHDRLVALFAAMARERPTLFVEALDMKARRGKVDFELRGTVWCWTPVNTH